MKDFKELSVTEVSSRIETINSFLSIPLGMIITVALIILVVFSIVIGASRRVPIFPKLCMPLLTGVMLLLLINYNGIVVKLESELVTLNQIQLEGGVEVE